MIDLGIGTIQVKLSTGEVKTFDDVIAFGDSEQDDNFFKIQCLGVKNIVDIDIEQSLIESWEWRKKNQEI